MEIENLSVPACDAISNEPTVDRRTRSKILFVYSDLEAAAGLAAKLRANARSTTCDVKQLATWMNQSAAGGTFRSILGAARTFGLVDTQRGSGTVSLTKLGQSVTEEAEHHNAIAIAFMEVPLHAELYKQYEGNALPPAPAIERHIESLGVPPKQKERARLTFAKSAQFAGFIDQSSGRFIKPATAPTAPAPEPRKGGSGGGDDGDGLDLDPLLVALLKKLPPVGEEWPQEPRARWMRTLAMNLSQIYDTGGHPPVDLVIKGEANNSV